MDQIRDPLLILALALNFVALGVSRVRAVINAVALQGALLGILGPLVHPTITWHGLALAGATLVLKGFIIPALLLQAVREADIQREVTPRIDYISSLLLGALGTGLAIVFARTLPLATEHAGLLLVPASLATVFTGFLLLTTRQTAILQVLGYLVLENGIFLFGLLLLEAVPLLVEIGALLDLFTGIFVMGIIIHHISREFTSVGSERPSELED
jgi:hydrogenase-4 component E